MLVPRQQYSRELKVAVMREIDSGKGMAEVARMYQLSPKRLETWKGEWRAKGELAFPGKNARPQIRLDADRIAELERKIGQQTMEIDFLKKTLRRFRDRPLLVVANGNTRSMNKSGKRRKRGQL
jgi:transposase